MRTALLLVLIFLASIQAQSTAQERHDLGDVTSQLEIALKRRTEWCKTLKVEWRQSFVTGGSAASRMNSSEELAVSSPENLRTVDQIGIFQIRDECMSYELRTPEGGLHQIPTSDRGTFDGVDSFNLATFSDATPFGSTSKSPYHFNSRSVAILPLLLSYRPLSAMCGRISLKSCDIEVSPDQHFVVCRSGVDTAVVDEYWFDRSSAFLPRRFVSLVNGVSSIDMEIEYEGSSPKWNALPVSWKYVFTEEDGSLGEQLTAIVTHSDFNVPIADSEFTISFPPGTLVVNADNGTRRVVPLDGTPERSISLKMIAGVSALSIAILAALVGRRFFWKG